MNPWQPGNENAASATASVPAPMLVRALFGPILLMVLGVLFVIEYSGGPRFGQTWPALIIAAGLLKLGEFLGARQA